MKTKRPATGNPQFRLAAVISSQNMESLEKFLETRMRQSRFQAMMIPRYLENPDRFMGKRTPTMEQAAIFSDDAEKCKNCLELLKAIQAQKRVENRNNQINKK